MGMPWRSMKALEKLLLASSCAAFAEGPKHGTPAAVRSSTMPETDTERWGGGKDAERLGYDLRSWCPPTCCQRDLGSDHHQPHVMVLTELSQDGVVTHRHLCRKSKVQTADYGYMHPV